MKIILDIVYFLALLVASPVLLVRMVRHGRYRRGWSERLGKVPARYGLQPVIWIHGVSLGEVGAARGLVAELHSQLPDFKIVISSTTDTGLAAAQRFFAPAHDVFQWPMDFSWAVKRAMNRLRPDLVILIEGEVWPNFLAECNSRGVPAVVVNGRMSPNKGYPRYKLLGKCAGKLFNRLTAIGVQDEVSKIARSWRHWPGRRRTAAAGIRDPGQRLAWAEIGYRAPQARAVRRSSQADISCGLPLPPPICVQCSTAALGCGCKCSTVALGCGRKCSTVALGCVACRPRRHDGRVEIVLRLGRLRVRRQIACPSWRQRHDRSCCLGQGDLLRALYVQLPPGPGACQARLRASSQPRRTNRTATKLAGQPRPGSSSWSPGPAICPKQTRSHPPKRRTNLPNPGQSTSDTPRRYSDGNTGIGK